MKKQKKKGVQEETTIFMWIWIVLFSLSIVLELINFAFGDTINIKSILFDLLYLVFFCFGYYFAKKEKLLAGIIELITGSIIVLNDILPNNILGLSGIIGILVIIHSILYMYYFKKNKKSK